uniref:Neur_chan_LBD domain-containing protein n=1 Tax=Heterorhabditis bacteriophora TaxID=37862 RepID=A0A1I7XMN7_HETBA
MAVSGETENNIETIAGEEDADTDDLDEILAGDLDSKEIIAAADKEEDSRYSTEPSSVDTTTKYIHRIEVEAQTSPMQPQTSDTEILERLLSRGYDWRVRPPGQDGTLHGGPVVVAVNIISKIDNVNMEYSVQLTFRESWRDSRLTYGSEGDTLPEFLILTAGQQIWMPDSFFQNEKQAYKHMIDKPNVLIRVHKDGTVLYSVRISLVLSCPMHLQYYPMDVQQCLIDLASYAYTTKDIEYVWKSDEPVQLKQGLSSSLPSFQLNNINTCSYYLLQLYIPSCMLVIVSWVSFWIDRSAVPARVTLGVTTLLTMTTQSSGINAKLPPVAYIKAIDVWIGEMLFDIQPVFPCITACMTFIFGALLEFAWVTYIANRTKSGTHEDGKNSLLIKAQSDVWVPRIIAEQERELDKVKMTLINRKHKKSNLYRWLERRSEWQDRPKRADLVSSK